jgi:IS5 family transposase
MTPRNRDTRGKAGARVSLVAADAGFYSGQNQAIAKARGGKRVCIPNHGSKSASRKREQKKRWFRDGQRWRTGCEGRISVSKRRHGLQRCRYRGDDGMKRWVGLAVIADNLINLGRFVAARQTTSPVASILPRSSRRPPTAVAAPTVRQLAGR